MAKSLEAIAFEVKGAEEERRLVQENGEGNVEIEKLKEFRKEIKEAKKDYKLLFLIEPTGGEGKSYEEEHEIFYEKVKENLDNEEYLSDGEYSEMSPTFKYPRIENIDIENLEEVILKLQEIRKKVEKEFDDINIAKMLFESLDIAEAEMNFVKYEYYGDLKKSFESSKIFYGDINEELFEKCNDMYEENIEFLKKHKEKSEAEKKLESLEFDSESIKAFFNVAIIKAGLRDSGFEAVVTNIVNNIRVSTKYPGYNHPVVMIPPDRKINGMKLIKLVAHEVGRHIATNVYNKKQGFTDELGGKEWNLFSEGIALVSEDDVEKEVLGDSYQENENDSGDRTYFILAMEKIKDGWNFAKVYKYIYKKRYEEELHRQGYYDIKSDYESSDKQNENLKIKFEELKTKSRRIAVDTTKKICLRVFKGFNPKNGGLFLLKDKIYVEGKIKSMKLRKIDSGKKLEEYLRLSKVDPEFIPYLIKVGAYSYKKSIEAATRVAEKIWKEEGWPKELLQGNKKSELFMPYMNDFMDKYYEDEWKNSYDDGKKMDW